MLINTELIISRSSCNSFSDSFMFVHAAFSCSLSCCIAYSLYRWKCTSVVNILCRLCCVNCNCNNWSVRVWLCWTLSAVRHWNTPLFSKVLTMFVHVYWLFWTHPVTILFSYLSLIDLHVGTGLLFDGPQTP